MGKLALLIITISLCQVLCLKNVKSSNQRHKRLYNGKEIKDDDFPYIVFLKSMLKTPNTSDNDCTEKMCTGTLVHERFVLTLKSCVDHVKNASEIKVSKINTYGFYNQLLL